MPQTLSSTTDSARPIDDALSAAILAAARDAILIWDESGRIEQWNPPAEALMGELQGRSLEDVMAPQSQQSHWWAGQGEDEAAQEEQRVFLLRDRAPQQELTVQVRRAPGEHWHYVGEFRPADLPPHDTLHGPPAQTQALTRALLAAPSSMALLLDEKGTILAYNTAAEEFFWEDIAPRQGQRLADLLPASTTALLEERAAAARRMGRAVSMEWEWRNRWLDVVFSPLGGLKDRDGRVAIFAHFINELKRVEQRAERLARIYAVLSKTNEAIIRSNDIQVLYDATCRIAVEEGHLRMAWIALLIDEGTHILPVAISGHDEGYVAALRLELEETTYGSGPTGVALRTGNVSICNDIVNDARMRPWREQALARGYRASAAFPIRAGERIFGALNLYTETPHFFNEAETRLFTALADDVGFAVQSIEKEHLRQQALADLARSEEQFRAVVDQASDGMFITDRRGFFLDVNVAGCALLGYETADILEMHFTEVIWDEDLIATPITLQDLQDGEAVLLEWRLLKKDGSLRQCEISAKALPDGRLLAIVRDISARKQNEEALRHYARQLEILRTANFALTKTLDLDIVLQTLLKYLADVIPFDSANVMLLEDRHRLVMRAARGYEAWTNDEAIQYLTFDAESTPSFDAILRSRQSLLIPDTEQFAGWIHDPLTAHIRSWLGIPLISGGHVIGFFALDKVSPHFFKEAHIEMAEALAAQAAVAIENARYYEQIRRRTRELEILLDLSSALRQTMSVDEMLDILLADVVQSMGGLRGMVALAGNDSGTLSIHSSLPAGAYEGGRTIDLEDERLVQALGRGEICIFSDSLLNPQPFDMRPPHDRPGIVGRALCIPLTSRQNLLGLIEIILAKDIVLSAKDRQLLTTFAEMGSITLARLRFQETLAQEVEERTREILRRQQVAEGLRYILTILNSDRSLQEVLDYIVSQACWLLDTSTGAIIRQDQESAEPGQIVVVHGLPASALSASAGPVALAMRQGRTVTITDLNAEGDEVGERATDALDYRALVAVPLMVAQEIYGCLALYFPDPRSFNEEDIAIAISFADQATLAIENAHLRAEAEESAVLAERNRLARELHDAVTQSLFSASIISDVLPQVWEKNPEEGKKRLQDIRRLTRGALAEMRALLLELRPKALTEVGLGVLLEHLSAAAANRAQIPIDLEVENPQPLAPDVQIGLYRIAQEALNNIVKHAAATHAAVHLHFQPAAGGLSVHMRIEDNGQGFTPGTSLAHHLGLKIMRERAEALDAILQVNSEHGKGTEIIVNWPALH